MVRPQEAAEYDTPLLSRQPMDRFAVLLVTVMLPAVVVPAQKMAKPPEGKATVEAVRGEVVVQFLVVVSQMPPVGRLVPLLSQK